MGKRSWPWLLLLLVPLAQAAAPPPAPAQLQGLDAYVQQVMHDWRVPGLAIAIVKDGKVVLARGYGAREIGKPGAVDADTLFDIGSNSKAFTAATLGTLVAQKRLEWDTRVADVLPSFRLDDAWVTQTITLRDLLTHRSGYCDPEAAWYTSDASDILERVRFQKPRYGFRTTFCYNNVQYLAASRMIPALTGKSWDDYVAAQLFQPLGMDRTVSTEAGVAAAGNVAAPHALVGHGVSAISRYWPRNMDVFSAVGGIWSSANDMGRWMQTLLADGEYRGVRVLDAHVVRAMETPQMLIGAGTGVGDEIRAWMPGGTFYAYGLGLFVQDWHGHELAWHAGDIDGMASAMVLAPDEGLGITVLSNMNQANARFAIVNHVLQAMLDTPRQDTEPALLAAAASDKAESDAAARKLADTREPGAKPTLALSAYAGDYKDPFDGAARVTVEHDRLVIRLGNPDFTGDLTPWHGDTFRVAWRHAFYGSDWATFDIDALGHVARLELSGMALHFRRATPRSPRVP